MVYMYGPCAAHVKHKFAFFDNQKSIS